MNIQVAQIVPVTEAEGPGSRFALWFQGCPFRCPGCCNLEMLPFKGSNQTTVEDVVDQIKTVQKEIEGITLLGGEPFAHAEGATLLAEEVHKLDLSVMIFTGYLLEDLQEPVQKDLLNEVDILVDGPYMKDLPETKRRWIGSSNQKIHYLSRRCDPEDKRWLMPNTLEIRLKDREITINGFPAKSAVGVWKRLKVL